jgi:hypothetical protein
MAAGWIAETEAKRKVEQMRLDQAITKVPRRLSEEEIAAMARKLGDLRKLLHSADPQDKADVYEQLGLRMTYDPGQKTVIARAQLRRSCTKLCSRGEPNLLHTASLSPLSSCWDRGEWWSRAFLRCATSSVRP